jgi:hypothetical protein
MAGPVFHSHAPCHGVLLHLPWSYCTFLKSWSYPLVRLNSIPSVRLQYPPPCPARQHADRLSPLSRYFRLHPPTTHTKRVTFNQGEFDLCDAPGEPCRCWSHHRRLHPARSARCSTGAPRHTRVPEPRRLDRSTRACAIDGTFAFSYLVESWQH